MIQFNNTVIPDFSEYLILKRIKYAIIYNASKRRQLDIIREEVIQSANVELSIHELQILFFIITETLTKEYYVRIHNS